MCAGVAFNIILGSEQSVCLFGSTGSQPPKLDTGSMWTANSPLIVLRYLAMLHDPAPVQGLQAEVGRLG